MFSAASLSVTARKAVRVAGLATVGTFEPVHDKPQWYIENEPDNMEYKTIAFRAYSPNGTKDVEVKWADVWYVEQYGEDIKPARAK